MRSRGEDQAALDAEPGENRVSSEGPVTVRQGGWIVWYESPLWEKDNVECHLPICLPLFLAGTMPERPPCPTPDP